MPGRALATTRSIVFIESSGWQACSRARTSRPRSDMPFSRTLISGARKRYHMALMHATLWCLPCGAQRMRSTPGWSPRACLTTWIARSSTFSAPAPIWIDSALFREALPGQAKGL
jgi:hypothetical protein